MDRSIRDLLNKHEWEIKTLEEIATDIYSGNEVTKSQLNTGTYPAIRYCEIHKSNICITENHSFVDPALIKNKKYCEYGDFIITRVSENIEQAGKGVAYLGQKCILGAAVLLIKHDQNPKFLSYMGQTKSIRRQIKALVPNGVIMNFKTSYINKIKIPLPPRHIQDLIADYLDKGTELEKELDFRKRQYKHYKEVLLSGGIDRWDIKTLSEIATDIYTGAGVTREQLNTGNFPAIKCRDINSQLGPHFKKCISYVDEKLLGRKKYFEHGDILISIVGDRKTSGSATAYLGNEKCILGEGVYTCKHNQNPKYLSYVLSSKFCRRQIESLNKAGSVFNFCIKEAKRVKIPLPSLEEQERIVEKLDAFHTITSDLEHGIPKMLHLIREQCKYYKEEILRPILH